MPKIYKGTVTIHRSIEDIFSFLSDGTNNDKWRTDVISTTLVDGTKNSVGAIYHQILRGPTGVSIQGNYTITESIPNEKLAFQVLTQTIEAKGEVELIPIDAMTTTVNFTIAFLAQKLNTLFGFVIQKQMQTELAYLQNLKFVLEGSSAI